MKNTKVIKMKPFEKVSKQYKKAYDKQYSEKDLYAALQTYKRVVAKWPDLKEADYSRTQVQNIFREVVPKGVIFDTQLKMALAYAKSN